MKPTMILVAIKLDNSKYGAGPGTVVGFPSSVDEYFKSIRDRDGAHNPSMRLWQAPAGSVAIGDRVQIKQF